MKLTREGLREGALWEEAGYDLPNFDFAKIEKNTKEHPRWIHFGGGNIFRAFQANVVQKLLNDGLMDTGLIVAEGYDYEIIDSMNAPHDNLSILVTLKADGKVEKTVVGSVLEAHALDRSRPDSFRRLEEVFCSPDLQMATFTITEKGYSLVNARGQLLSDVAEDFQAGPVKANSYLGKVAALLYARFQAGAFPIAMVSMDNCSHNGDKLSQAMKAFAEKWTEANLAEPAFLTYVSDSRQVSFPWTMIDKITPRPDAQVEALLKADGVEDLEPVVTGKNTYIAPFVNAEECEYLVLEDAFPNGRPALEKGGFLFTGRETVDQVEKMKVCTCLNPLHTALAVFGCLLGYEKISAEMKDEQLSRLVEKIGYEEGLPVVVDPKILNPKAFIDTVIQVRFPNPFMPDTPQRIATDTSQKLAIRFGETVKAYAKDPDKKVETLTFIPLVYAGWLRYLCGVNDAGEDFVLSPDPLLEEVCSYVADLDAAKEKREVSVEEVKKAVLPLLKNKQIFAVDLEEMGLSDLVCSYLAKMLEGPGAVRRLLVEML